ncbi:sulfotransferase [bacterium]|nr:sulfotransferase [bacterium]
MDAWAAPPPARLVLVLSSERSGSTLLRVILGEHSRIVAPQELFLLRYPDFDAWRARKPEALESLLEFFLLAGHPLSESAIEAACRGRATTDVYEWMLTHLPAGGLLIDKTPAYANDSIALVRSASLRPFYIWLIRHPLAVVDSHVRLKEAAPDRRPLPRRVLRPIRAAVERLVGGMSALAREREAKWVVQNLNIQTFLRRIPGARRATVHYEDLVRQPDAVIASLCAAMGIAFEPGMLQPETRQRQNPHLGDPNFHRHAGIDRQTVESWRNRYEERHLRPETLQLMQQIGVRRADALHASAA